MVFSSQFRLNHAFRVKQLQSKLEIPRCKRSELCACSASKTMSSKTIYNMPWPTNKINRFVMKLLNTFLATDKLSRQLIFCDVCHWWVYLSVSSCNVMVHRRCSRPPAGATVGLVTWSENALVEKGTAVNMLKVFQAAVAITRSR